MAGNCKYYKQERYVSYDSGQTWSGTGVYQQGALIASASTDCGYVPPVEPQYRDISGNPYCNGYDKYVDVEHQVSYDSGSTWTTTATTPTLVEANSEYCHYVPPTPPTPSGDSRQYLTFRPNGDTEYWFSYGDSENYTSISYSLNSGSSWTVVDHNQHTVTVHSGDTIMWRGEAANLGMGIGHFNSSGSTFEVEGNVMSLLYFDNFSGQTSLASYGDYVFKNLFADCTSLTSAENMVLPATTLTDWCYSFMFDGCTSLTTVPILSATTLADACYYAMFWGCTSLTTVPSNMLPAMNLSTSCYDAMFSGCTSLTTAPTLPATTLAKWCYSGMFMDCTNLSSVTCLASSVSAEYDTHYWLYGVAASGTFTTPSSTNWTSGKDGIPYGWTRVNA